MKKCRQICYTYTETISNYNPKPSNCSEQSNRMILSKTYQGRRDRRNFERTRKQQFNVARKQSDSISALCVTWPQDIIYCDMINEYAYVTYVKRRYCKTRIVFDGYGSGPSINDVLQAQSQKLTSKLHSTLMFPEICRSV